MSGGGKGGSTTSQVQVPQWLSDAAQANLAKANEIAKIGNVDYRGPDVAAFTPMQQAAFSNTNSAANAFGLPSAPSPMAGMPAPTTYAGGVQGHSSAPIYDQAKAEMQRINPAQYAAVVAPFINPVTAAPPAPVYAAPPPPPAPVARAAAPAPAVSRAAPQGSGASKNYGSTASDKISQSYQASKASTSKSSSSSSKGSSSSGKKK